MQDDPSNLVWIDRYDFTCPPEEGKIVTISGLGDRDYYNPTICEVNQERLLAFRLETRESSIFDPANYHPSIAFAAPDGDRWRLVATPAPFDMLEDPFFFKATLHGQECVLLGGVRVDMQPHDISIQTELYIGNSLHGLSREPYAIIHGMKDVRLQQLPDGRFLLCRRPKGEAYGEGRITLHMLDSLEQVIRLDSIHPPTLAILDSGHPTDWVGTNSIYALRDDGGEQWIGLLSHLALRDKSDGRHYAVTTYKIKLGDLLSGELQDIMPNLVATRACFERGPEKTHGLSDVVFPGCLEPLGNEKYRLWAGLSDARVGTIIVDDPFRIRTAVASEPVILAA